MKGFLKQKLNVGYTILYPAVAAVRDMAGKSFSMYGIALFIFLIASFFIRVSLIDFPGLHNSDIGRDYLISHHIVAYSEFPVNGPGSSIGIVNNALYEYVLAFFLLFYDNFFTLTFVNIFLQVASIALVYFIGKHMFNAQVGITSAVLFGLASYVIRQSEFIWQVHLMQPIILLSFFLLLLSYLKKSYGTLLFAVLSFAIAGSTQFLAFLILPLFFVLVFFIAKECGWSGRQYLTIGTVFLGTLFFLYLPLILYALQGNTGIFPSEGGPGTLFNLIAKSLAEIKHDFIGGISTLIYLFFGDFTKKTLATFGLWLVVCSSVFYLITEKRDSAHFKRTLILLTSIFQFFLCLALINFPILERHYVTPVLGIFALTIATIICKIFSNTKAGTIFSFFLVAFLSFVSFESRETYQTSPGFTNLKAITSVTDVIKQEVLAIQRQEKFVEPYFFKIRSYHGTQNSFNPYLDANFWIFLEKSFGKKFTKITNGYGQGYTTTNHGNFIFLICVQLPFKQPEAECLRVFREDDKFPERQNYRGFKKIYDQHPFVVFVSKKS